MRLTLLLLWKPLKLHINFCTSKIQVNFFWSSAHKINTKILSPLFSSSSLRLRQWEKDCHQPHSALTTPGVSSMHWGSVCLLKTQTIWGVYVQRISAVWKVSLCEIKLIEMILTVLLLWHIRRKNTGMYRG